MPLCLGAPEGATGFIGRQHLNVYRPPWIGGQEPAQEGCAEPLPTPGWGDAELPKPKRPARLGPLGVAREGWAGAEEHGVLSLLEPSKKAPALGGDGAGVPGRAPFVLKQR